MKKIILVIAIFCFISTNAQQRDSLYNAKMEWFKDAKLGIFIHWGIYAVKGIGESWSFYNEHITHEDYLAQVDGFTAKNYDPEYWAKLIKESGAKYSVITSKHHDGFALWNTEFGKLNAVENSAAKKDVLTPFVNALRKNNLNVGIYFSLPDWSYKDYDRNTRNLNRYNFTDDPKRWNNFKEYMMGQLSELSENYNPDLWWFDGDWEHKEDAWGINNIKSLLLNKNPMTIMNSRLRGKGDYDTPENGPPVVTPNSKYWELCLTMNDSWGYQPNDKNYKTPQQVIDIFVDCLGKGGNLLLDIGPKADGTIAPEQENILKELGKWTSKHQKVIYKMNRGIPFDHYYGPNALSADSTKLYLFVKGNPNGQVSLRGISNKINSIVVVGNGTSLNHKTISKIWWSKYPGVTYIDIPEEVIDEYYTVLSVSFAEPIKLYRKVVGAIESN